ncbi:hypothetical protein [Hymenobacter canadensis]|uniref:DUF5034 domain-containing protein n=1 Tax=Hymenobacter canadensis TaxID=2999067 RepID=A0ABY7LNB1_9BACT|nr:hypothetical protein [Hymenobacter canadensis]WBA41928.1 hypothetical protein O3303_19225 [Hymenobacter canadensis]
MKKLLLCALVIVGLPACDTCGPFERQYFDVIGLSAVALRQAAGTTAQVLTAGQASPVAELKLLLNPDTRLYSAAPARTGGFAAVACDPADPTYTEMIDSIRVTSRYDFDAQHPAGTSLNDLLLLDNGYGRIMTLNELLLMPQSVPVLTRRNLQFSQTPTSSVTQQFRVRYHQTNGEVYTAETVPVTIQP